MTRVGQRVELVRSTDPYTRLVPGEKGTVTFVDALGTVHVQWDSGARLGLVREAGDSWRDLDDDPERVLRVSDEEMARGIRESLKRGE